MRRLGIWRFIISGLFMVVAAVSGWQMMQRPLWGYWPWPFFIGLWWAIFLLLGWKKWDNPDHLKFAAAATLSGLLLAAAFPVSPLTFLIFIAWIPLLWLVDKFKQQNLSGATAFYYAYHAFALWNLCTTWWVANTAFIAGIVAIFLNSFFMASVFWLYYKFHDRLTPFLRVLALPVLWTSFEYLHLNWEISWPWLNLGNYFASRHTWVQWYEYTGTFGGSTWVWLVNIIGWFCLKNKFKSRNRDIKLGATFFIIIIGPIILSLFIYFNWSDQGESVKVAVVQPNFEPHFEKFNLPDERQLPRFLDLSRQVLDDSIDYLIFPETSFGNFDVDELNTYPVYKDLVSFLKRYPDVKLITGLSSYKKYTEDNKPPKDLYERKTASGTLYFEVQNSAVQMDSGGVNQLYLKSKFVPGAEIFPYKHLLPFLRPLVNKLGGSMTDWGQQKDRTPFTAGQGRVGPIICYESVYGEYVSGYVRSGANFLAIMTNDGWWDNTPGHKQHAALGKLRAIEQRKSIARSANMGTSGFINQRGDLISINEYGVAQSASQDIKANHVKTFYNQWGDIIARIALFLLFIMVLVWGRSFIPKA